MSLTFSAEPSVQKTNNIPAEHSYSDFSGNALRILHRALIRLRLLAFEGTEPKTIGWMLDDIEYIGVLAMESRIDSSPERMADFRQHLLGLETKYPAFGQLSAVFDAWQNEPGTLIQNAPAA